MTGTKFFNPETRADYAVFYYWKNRLHLLMSQRFYCQLYRINADDLPVVEFPGSTAKGTRVLAAVLIHNEIVAGKKATGMKEAKSRAATEALKILDDMTRRDFTTRYNCNCNAEEDKSDPQVKGNDDVMDTRSDVT